MQGTNLIPPTVVEVFQTVGRGVALFWALPSKMLMVGLHIASLNNIDLDMKTISTIALTIGIIAFIMGILFKILHLPLAGIIILSGGVLFIVGCVGLIASIKQLES